VSDSPSTTPSRTAVTAVADRYLRQQQVERGRSVNTIAAYRRDLTAYAGYLEAAGITDIDAVAATDVEGYVGSLRSREHPLAPSSVARMLSAVRGLHRFAVEESLAADDPTADARPPKAARRLPKAIGVDEVTALLEAASGDDPLRLRDRALLEFLYATGARVSEAVGLDLDDVAHVGADGAEGGEIVRLFGKGGKQRIVPLGSFAVAALEAYLVRSRPILVAGARDPRPLFLGARGGRLSRQHVWLIIRETAERAGIAAELSPHTMRHSFATHLLQGGADVRVVQELLGHASVATTQIYTKVTADALRDMYQQAHPRAR
jgi:integrase/recombinase XerD